jgi:monofunctional glycosyltransferase
MPNKNANNLSSKKFVATKIILAIFVLHVCWFLFFIFQKFPVQDFVVANLKLKMLLVFGVVFIVAFVYYKWLRKIDTINLFCKKVFKFFLWAYAASIVYFIFIAVINPPITLTQINSLISGNGLNRNYVSYNQMGSNIKLAVIASEDQLFPDHDGFDLKAIKLAMKYNKKHPNKIRGASTISQQTAKNIFLFQGGGFLRKGPEVFFTFTIEQWWSKQTILERYLNIAEMGQGIFGVQAAAKKYFNKDAINLTRGEAAQIAACLPNPQKYTVKPLSAYVANRYDDIMRQMNILEQDEDVAALIK